MCRDRRTSINKPICSERFRATSKSNYEENRNCSDDVVRLLLQGTAPR
jgi:hypothetical protein